MIGCKPKVPPISDEQVIGSWIHSVELSPDDPMSAGVREEIDEIGQMELELQSDHTFTLSVAGSPSSGTWKTADSYVVLTFTDVGGLVPGDGQTARLSFTEGGLETEPSTSGATWLFARPPN